MRSPRYHLLVGALLGVILVGAAAVVAVFHPNCGEKPEPEPRPAP